MKHPGFHRGFAALVILYVLLAIGSATQSYLLRVETAPGEPPATKYNNYLIFKHSHFHLLEGKNLYTAYPYEHADLYKYSPAFALFFGAFARLPDQAGLALWNLLNIALFLLAIALLPVKDWKTKSLVLLLAAVETMTSLQNSQSNVLIAGLLILGFALFEKKHYFFATFCLVATFYIKIFGIATLIILLFYPEKRKSILCAAFWFVLLWFLPAVITGFKPLFTVYKQYMVLLQSDHSVSLGLSVAGWARSWLGLSLPTTALALAGFSITVLPLVRLRNFKDFSHRILLFSALLVWMVIFNHKAESPTFIIAVAGVLLWYFSRERTVVNTILLVLVVVFTSLSPTDLFPFAVRASLFEPYAVKAVPCILVWAAMVVELYREPVLQR
jgi:hypothetical protein